MQKNAETTWELLGSKDLFMYRSQIWDSELVSLWILLLIPATGRQQATGNRQQQRWAAAVWLNSLVLWYNIQVGRVLFIYSTLTTVNLSYSLQLLVIKLVVAWDWNQSTPPCPDLPFLHPLSFTTLCWGLCVSYEITLNKSTTKPTSKAEIILLWLFCVSCILMTRQLHNIQC